MSVRSTIDLSYNDLPESAARAYRWLSVCPGRDFSGEVAMAALDTSVDETGEVLDTLVNARLLDADGFGRYRFPPLARDRARALTYVHDSAAEGANVVHRVLEYYLSYAVAADHVVMPQEPHLGPSYDRLSAEPVYASGVEALDAAEAELSNLMAALRAGGEYGFDDLVWQLCEAMWALFLYRKHFPDWIAAYRLGIEAACHCRNDAALSLMHHHAGFAYHNLAVYHLARRHGREALNAARSGGHELGEIQALGLIGIANRGLKRYDEAITDLRESVDLAHRTGLRRAEALARRRLGQTLDHAGHLHEAVQQLRQAKDQAAALRDAHVEANTTVWLAKALAHTGGAQEAVALLTEIWDTVRTSGSDQYQAQALWVRGETTLEVGDTAAARDLLTQARDLYTAIGAPHAETVQETLDSIVES